MPLIRSLLASIILTATIACLPVYSAELSVFAASSLAEVLREVAHSYEAENPGEQILLNFAGSQALATQIEQGAPADLFISANRSVMKRLQRQTLVEQPLPLLRNGLILAARKDLQPPLSELKDLARPNQLLAIGNPQVPIGDYTRQLLSNLADDPVYGPELVKKIEANVVSQENQVKAIIAKLLLGEADVGIVYQSDLAAGSAASLDAIPLPQQHNPEVTYPMARVRMAEAASGHFVEYLHGKQARKVFSRHAFQLAEEQ